jgi:carbon storage regulator
MLIIGRKRDQKIIISDNIEITILEIGRNRVRFGIEAPKEVLINTKQQTSAVKNNGKGIDEGHQDKKRHPKSERTRAMTSRRNGG